VTHHVGSKILLWTSTTIASAKWHVWWLFFFHALFFFFPTNYSDFWGSITMRWSNETTRKRRTTMNDDVLFLCTFLSFLFFFWLCWLLFTTHSYHVATTATITTHFHPLWETNRINTTKLLMYNDDSDRHPRLDNLAVARTSCMVRCKASLFSRLGIRPCYKISVFQPSHSWQETLRRSQSTHKHTHMRKLIAASAA
jgi:hypothetical protein